MQGCDGGFLAWVMLWCIGGIVVEILDSPKVTPMGAMVHMYFLVPQFFSSLSGILDLLT
jgi:hypothetical protein